STEIPGELVARLVAAGAQGSLPQRVPAIVPIETPLVFSGFSEHTLGAFEPLFSQMGITAVQGGAGAGNLSAKPAPGWQHSLNPGARESALARQWKCRGQGEGSQLQCLRAAEVDAVPDDADVVQLSAADE